MKAFLVGLSEDVNKVSNYLNNLEVCEITSVQNAKINEFTSKFLGFCALLNQEDTAIFYFAGHGKINNKGKHEIQLGDNSIETDGIIQQLERSRSKNRLVILDCCYAGKVNISSKSATVEKNLKDIVGKGTEIFCACREDQEAYEDDNKEGFFTNIFLKSFDALNVDVQKGLSVKNLSTYIRRFFQMGLKEARYKNQTFVSVGDTVGDFYLIEPQPMPKLYQPKSVYYENDEFIIEEVKSEHSGFKKRYSVKVLLKFPFSIEKIKMIADEILSLSSGFEVYNTEEFQNRLSQEPISHLFCSFAYTKRDLLNANYYCQSKWVGEREDKIYQLKEAENSQLVDGTLLTLNPSYFFIGEFIASNTKSKTEIFELAKFVKTDAINIAQRIINEYNRFLNKDIFEDDLMTFVSSYAGEIEQIKDQLDDLGYASDTLHNWREKLDYLVGTLTDFNSCYNEKYAHIRDKENRQRLMNASIKSFNSYLEELAEIEEDLKSTLT